MERKSTLYKPLRYRWIIFSILAIGYILVYVHRVSTAIIAPELIKTFGISGTMLGFLTSAYFYAYAGMQLPMGLLADSLGPRKTVTFFLVIMFAGTILFGLSPNIYLAITARVLIGLSGAALFISTVKIITEWYRPNEFATMTGALLSIGGFGWLVATAPLALLVNWLGWRVAFVSMGITTLVLAILTFLFVRDRPYEMNLSQFSDTKTSGTKVNTGLLRRVKVILSEKYVLPLGIRLLLTYGTVIGYAGLWGGPYLTDVYGLSTTEAGRVLMMTAIGVIVGCPILGWLSDKIFAARKPIIVFGSFIYLLVWVVLVFWIDDLNIVLLYLVSFLMGTFGTGVSMICLVAQKELFPKQITGTAMGFMNVLPFGGAAVIPPLMGYLMDKVGRVAMGAYPVSAYKQTFSLCLLLAGVAFLGVCFNRSGICNALQ